MKTTPLPEPKKETVKPAEVAPKVPPVVVPAAPDVRKLLNEGRAALALKDYNTAATKYEAVLGLEPTNTVALANLGVIRYQQNRLDDAEQYLRKAAAAAPNDSSTRSLLGVVYFRKGAIEDAYSELNRAVAIDPHNAEAHNYLGIVLSEKGELVVAEATPAEFKPLARAQVLTGRCWVAPVLANGRIYCRSNLGTLVCLDVRATAAGGAGTSSTPVAGGPAVTYGYCLVVMTR